MHYSLTDISKNIPKQNNKVRIKTAFRYVFFVSWSLLILALYPLIAYVSPNAVLFQRYSLEFTVGLGIYILTIISSLFLLGLSDKQLDHLSERVNNLLSTSHLYLYYVGFCIFLTTSVLLIIRLWGWGYISLLQYSLITIGLWFSIAPIVWIWIESGVNLWWFSPNQIYSLVIQNTHIWVTPAVVTGVVILSTLLGYIATPKEMIFVPIFLVGIGAILLFSYSPPLGLVAVIASILIPINGPSGVNATLGLVTLLFGLWILKAMGRQKIEFTITGPIWALICLVIVAILALGFGQLPWYTFAQSAPWNAQIGGLLIYLLSAAAFVLVAYQIENLVWLKAMVWVFLIIAAVNIALQIIPGFAQFRLAIFQTVEGGSLFWVWLVAIAFSQAAFNKDLSPIWRLILIGLVGLTLYVAYSLRGEWKSGWVPPMVAIAATIAARSWRFALIMAVIGTVPAIALATEAIATDQYSYSTRVEAWLIVLEIIKVNPVVGLGFGNYSWYTPLFPIRGYAVQFNSHSQYVDLIAQTGLLGLICFLWFFIAVGWKGWQVRDRVSSGFAQAYVYGALGGLAATLVAAALGDWVLPFYYNVGLRGFRASVLSWLFLGGLLALGRIYANRNNKLEES